MSQQKTIVGVLERGRGMLRKHLADFTDADMLVRPVPGANHVAWQLSHLINATNGMAKVLAPAANVALPAKVEGVGKSVAPVDDPARFATKEELLTAIEALIEAIAGYAKTATDADLDTAPPEPYVNFAPTKAALALMVPLHMSMHVGQIQVIRRKLSKPVLF